jgi:CDP-paratose 2-epimerase
LHGFLSFLVKTAVKGGTYRIFGYKGKQVRDQIHSTDVVAAIEAIIAAPRSGEAYNIGGGRESNASILECLDWLEERLGRRMKTEYVDKARIGDHICYISDLAKFKGHYPGWRLTRNVKDIVDEIAAAEGERG